ncbi:MAG: hypothetical protein R2882_12490 [Gemmatimonadales bacterium]
MAAWLLRRLVHALVTLAAVAALLFVLMRLAPGDPLGRLTEDRPMAPAEVARLRRLFGLDQPIGTQLADFAGRRRPRRLRRLDRALPDPGRHPGPEPPRPEPPPRRRRPPRQPDVRHLARRPPGPAPGPPARPLAHPALPRGLLGAEFLARAHVREPVRHRSGGSCPAAR